MSNKVEKVKKRKRTTDGSSKPSKRVAIEEDKQVQVSVSEVGKWAPVIGMNVSAGLEPRAAFMLLLCSVADMDSFHSWPGSSDHNPIQTIHQSSQQSCFPIRAQWAHCN